MTYRQAIVLASNRLHLPNEQLPALFRRLPEASFRMLDDEIEGDPMAVVRGIVNHFRERKAKRNTPND